MTTICSRPQPYCAARSASAYCSRVDSWWRRRILSQIRPLRRRTRLASVIRRLPGNRGLAHPMQGHLSQHNHDAAPAFAGQPLPNRRRQIAHCEIQANAPTRTALGTRFSVIRRAPSNYERQCQWDIKTALDELKTHVRGANILLRSKTQELVRQEFFGLMMLHFAVRGLMHEAALQVDEDPDRLSFLHAVRVVRRKLPFFGAFSPSGQACAA